MRFYSIVGEVSGGGSPYRLKLAANNSDTTSSNSLCCSFLFVVSSPVTSVVEAINTERDEKEAAKTSVDVARTGVHDDLGVRQKIG